MAHRGRLSVLAHNLGRSLESIMAEFEGAKAIDAVKRTDALRHGGTGDVKYHHGAEGLFESGEGDVRMRLSPNPSHLEFVDPVVEGGARAAQTEHSGPRLHHDPKVAVPLLLHGDAAFPGQGVVAETLNLQSLEGYATGGTIHIITDNQVGFTTDPMEGRSTPYASDMAKGFNVPIIHVNADAVEDCIAAARLAMAYRDKFARDVVIDLIGYRRYGHNETDEPAYTQPQLRRADQEAPAAQRALRAATARGGGGRGEGGRGGGHRPARGAERDPQGPAREDRGRRVRGPDRDRHRRARPDQEPRGRDEGLREADPDAERGADQVPRLVHRAPQAAQAARAPPRDPRRGADRVRPRRGARLRVAADRGDAHPPDRPGHRARHLLEPPPRPIRREDRASSTRRSRTSRARSPRSRSTTARCRRTPASASSTATRPPRRRA